MKPNVPPTADFGTTCDYLDCDFDATASTDSDGTIDDYAWDFGDGQTGTGSTADHVYDKPGTYAVTLVVTDDDDATDDRYDVPGRRRGACGRARCPTSAGAVNQGNVATPNVTTPTTVVGRRPAAAGR